MPLTTYTAGDVLTAASLNDNFTFAAANPPGGLTFITGATFTTVASVSFANSTFTSTYQNYVIKVKITAASTTTNFNLRLRKAGVDNTSSYFSMLTGINSNAGAANITGNSVGFFTFCRLAGANDATATIELFNPQLNTRTGGQVISQGEDTSVGALGFAGGLTHNTVDQFDSATLLTSAGTMTGNYLVYGYANS